jgi:hypothetical protein
MGNKVLIRSINDGRFCNRQQLINEIKEMAKSDETKLVLYFGEILEYNIEECIDKTKKIDEWVEKFLPVIEALQPSVWTKISGTSLTIYVENNNLYVQRNIYFDCKRLTGFEYAIKIIEYFKKRIEDRLVWLTATSYEISK